jgi:hypothetical protein
VSHALQVAHIIMRIHPVYHASHIQVSHIPERMVSKCLMPSKCLT